MAIACTETSQAPIVDFRFKIAAFISFFYLVLGITKLTADLFFSFHPSRALSYYIDTSLSIVILTCIIYILLQLKRLFVERYHLHNMNNLINFFIILNIYGPLVIFFQRMRLISAHNTGTTGIWLAYWIFFIPGILLFGIFSIIFGKRLLKVKDQILDLYRIYAIFLIIKGVCLCSIILAPISVLPSLISTVVLGIIFLKESETETQVEFA